MAESSELVQGVSGQADIVLEDFVTRMMEVLNRCQMPTPSNQSSMAQIGIKLNNTNYVLWSQVIDIYFEQRQVKIYQWWASLIFIDGSDISTVADWRFYYERTANK